MFGQTFDPHDLATVLLLVVLEGVLSIDNALVLALLAKRLPKHQQARALTYGLAGAFVFRFTAIGAAAYLLQWRIVKLLGGAYLIWVAIKHLFFERDEEHEHVALDAENQPIVVHDATGRELSLSERDLELRARTSLPVNAFKHAGFWSTVVVIELTDIAFAVDSILAAIAVVGGAPPRHAGLHPKFWVILTGGLLGVMLMRVAATIFIRLLERFPRFETSAYLLVTVIGIKLIVDWALNTPDHPHMADFHSTSSLAFWIFWGVMALCIAFGFLPRKQHDASGSR